MGRVLPYRLLTALILCFCGFSAAKAQDVILPDEDPSGPPIFRHGIYCKGKAIWEGEEEWVYEIAEVLVFKELKFESVRQAKKYYKIARNIKIVYPIAVEIQHEVERQMAHLDSLPDKESRDAYTKEMEKKLTFSQGKLLIKLIDRQLGRTSYQLIKQYMGGFKAGFYNTFASLFGASLKKQYDPEVDDRLTERCIMLIESGQM